MNKGRALPAILAGFAGIAGTSDALAQAYQCRMDARISVPKVTRDGQPRLTPVAGYTLALSWSPEFCKGRETRRADAVQCSGRNGRFGFIVHGLWPEGPRPGSWPQYCPTKGTLNPAELRRNMCMMPSPRLAAHQWAKHGTCMVRRPQTYFKVTRILWDSLEFPEMDNLSRKKGLTAGDIRRALASTNPGISPQHIGVDLDGKGWLEEVHICYGKRFLPKPCDRRHYGAADKAPAKIWRGG